jgi:hypothetical protein
MDVPDWSGVS